MGRPVDKSNAKPDREPKKSYRTPSLVEYGAVRTLTTGGTGSVIEGARMVSLMRHP